MPVEAIYAIQNMATAAIIGATIALVAYSPVFRAIGNRIMHGRSLGPGQPADTSRMDELSDEMNAMRRQLLETQERLDFTERMLAQARERGALGAPKDA